MAYCPRLGPLTSRATCRSSPAPICVKRVQLVVRVSGRHPVRIRERLQPANSVSAAPNLLQRPEGSFALCQLFELYG
jgi:hypothetical protein